MYIYMYTMHVWHHYSRRHTAALFICCCYCCSSSGSSTRNNSSSVSSAGYYPYINRAGSFPRYTHTLIPLQYINAFGLFLVLLLISSGFLPTRAVTSQELDSHFCAGVCEGQGRASGCDEVRTAEACADAQWRLDYAAAVVVVVLHSWLVRWRRRILKIKRPCPVVIVTSASLRRGKHK